MPKRSLFAALLCAFSLAISLGGCATREIGDKPTLAAAATDEAGQSSDAPETLKVVSCQTLIDSGWSAPAGDPSFYYDPETGFVDIAIGTEQTLRVDLATDPACVRLPDIGAMLAKVPSDYELARLQECRQAVQDVANGAVPRKGDVIGSLDALRAHIVEWCPASFATQLRLEGSVQR